MRKMLIFIVLAALLVGGWWFFNSQNFSSLVQQYVENGEFVTLKARYTPESIMEVHRAELLADDEHSFLAPSLKFQPYILMEVKYTQPDKRSREGTIFWSLVDGEMVLNTENWEKTHGFEDAINADANRNDFKIMHALAKNRGTATVDQLQKELHVEREVMHPWIESAISKHLVVQNGHEVQLHFQDPKILVQPETKITDWLVKKPYDYSQRVARKYTPAQIEKIAKAAFGDDFTVRRATEVYLPIYSIEVQNPDGSVLTSYWNALNGQRISSRFAF